MSVIFSKIGQALLQLFIDGEILTIEDITACRHDNVKALPNDLSEAMHGKISRVVRRLLGDLLDEHRFYTKKIKQLEQDIAQYILEYFLKNMNG